MVFPAQNPTVSSIVPSENLSLPETPGVRNVPEPQEKISELFPPTPDQQKPIHETKEQGIDKGSAQPEPGKIVDEREQKISDTPVQSPQKLMTIADEEEWKFRAEEKKLRESDSTAHEQHS